MKQLLKTIKCGLHSGFPSCCILWYVVVWRLICIMLNHDSIFFKYYNMMQTKVCKKRGIGIRQTITLPDGIQAEVLLPLFGRVVCPLCWMFSKHTGHIKCDCGINN